MNRRRKKTGATLITVGGGLLAIGALKPLALVAWAPDTAYNFLLGIGAGAVGIGVLYFVLAIESPLPDAISYEAREAKRRELRTIWEFARDELPECPSWNTTKRHYKRTPGGFHVVERIIETRWWTHTTIVGFFTVVPVSDIGVKDLIAGSELQEIFIAPSFQSKEARGIYVGSIAARGWRAQGEALGYLRGTLRQLTGSGLRMAFTRPITLRGLKLAQHNDYSPVDPSAGDTELGLVYYRKY